ncbi:hypothetical protein PsorP6_006571 [Peronosclerospora sorghi]|uniref:Uncharacterized protein n=1 Tax=Peronosclerospora sorghi TaxID=230839 RepID=A0ACC0W3L4_9STRA|nr:hypothetical protein PsorP6_006571 [Peronosclerospora sorghi]
MRVFLTLLVCLAARAFLVFAADIPSVTKSRRGVPTKRVVDEKDNERMMRIPLQDTSMSYLEILRLRAKKALGMDVFKEFQVSDNALSTLTSPKLPQLISLYSESLEEQIKLSDLFTERYGDGQMALLLVDKRYSSGGVASDIAVTLLRGQLAGYLQKELSPGEVFKTLKQPIDENVFGDARLEVLEKYIGMYNAKNFGAETLVKVLTSVMNGEDKLFASITAAKAHSPLRERALKVEKSLIDGWKHAEHLNPEALLHRLGIEQSLDQLISLEAVWNYIAYYNSHNPEKQFSLVRWLTETIDEDVLERGLVKATGTDSTKEIAAALQQEQLELWLASKKTVDEVFILLKLKDEGHKLFESPKMETLNMYMEKFNAKGKKPDEALVTMFGVLLHAFGDSNLALLLLEAVESSTMKGRYHAGGHLLTLFSRWYRAGIDPSNFERELYYEEDKNIANQVKTLLDLYKSYYRGRRAPNGK